MSGSGDEQAPAPTLLQRITPSVIRRSFALKFGLVLLVMALSIGAMGVAATEIVTAQTESNVESEFLGDAGQQADIIEQWIERNELQVQLLSEDQVWAGGEIDLEVRRQQNLLSGDVTDVHVIDDDETQGAVVAASTDLEAGGDLTGTARAWFRDAEILNQEILALETDGVYVSDTYAVGEEHVVGFVSPTAEQNDRYLFVEVSVSEVQSSLRSTGGDRDSGFTQVVNTGTYQTASGEANQVMIDARGTDGKLLESYATDQETLSVLADAEALRSSGERAGVAAEMAADPAVIDEVYTVGYAPVADSDWVVVTHSPRSAVFGFVDTLSTWGLIITLGAVLLIGVAGSVLGYSTATSIDRLTRKTDEIREGDLDVALHSNRIDNIGRLYEGFDDMRDSLKEQIRESEGARKEAEVARAEAEELADYLQEKAEEYSEVMQEVSAGDLTRRMEQDGEEESMDRIAGEFNSMIAELEKTTGQLKSYVDEVEQAGAEVESSAHTVREASEQVADSIQKISDDAYEQKDRLDRLTTSMDRVAEDIEAVAAGDDVSVAEPLERIRETNRELEGLAELSRETMAESEEVAGAAEEQAAELNAVSERANDLQRYAQPLRDILERFETEAEHEFVFSVGPTGGAASPSRREDGDDA
jgi:methyl-accepting chemotaxis protein